MRNTLLYFGIFFLLIKGGIFAQTFPISNNGILQQLSKQSAEKFYKEKAYAIKMAKENGWEVIIENDSVSMELMRISKEGSPIYYITHNSNAAKSTRANTLHNGGILGLNLEGQGMTVHVWDIGIARTTHQEYNGIGGTDRFSVGDGYSTLSDHSAHVMGTIISSGVQPSAKGMAPQANGVGYGWSNDQSEVTTAAANGMLLSNHSYGVNITGISDEYFGQYSSFAASWDNIMYNAQTYLMVVSAGNDGTDNMSNASPLEGESNYDKLAEITVVKNNLVVANGNDAGIDVDGNLTYFLISDGSSQGPTDDYRIKPDISGNGASLYSTISNSDNSYTNKSGTSMAAPNVTGTLLLLQQHYDNVKSGYMKASTLKGLALHTADDVGIAGPDAITGWGLLNAKKAAQTITGEGTTSIIMENTLANSALFSFDVYALGGEDLIASISWTDPAGTPISGLNNSAAALVNDLDIRVTESTNTFYPHKLTSVTTNATGDNTVDPYERINVESPTYGTQYTITVTHKGTLSVAQNYSLIITGITVNDGSVPVSNFMANTTSTSEGGTIDFTDLSTNSPTSWTWSISPITGVTTVGGTTANSQNPQVQFANIGTYTITLTASNGEGTGNTETKTNYITVSEISTDIIMHTGDVTTCSGTFYDSGHNSNYFANEDYTLTIYPEEVGNKINVNFSMFDIEDITNCGYDYLEIYDGTSTSATLIDKYCGTTLPNETTATNVAGALTFKFHSDIYEHKAGWIAEVTCVPLTTSVVKYTDEILNVYPNPVGTLLHVILPTKSVEIKLLNMNGKTLKTIDTKNAQQIDINVEDILPGIYHLVITSENNEQIIVKVVKCKIL